MVQSVATDGPLSHFSRKFGRRRTMLRIDKAQLMICLGFIAGLMSLASGPVAAAVRIAGQVQAGGGPLVNSTVTLWVANTADPRQLAQTRTDSDGRFQIDSQETIGADDILYLIAKGGEAAVNKGSGDNPAVALLSVIGNTPPSTVLINEMTTVASVWTHALFLDGAAIKGHALGLKVAAGNVPSFVDLQTGGWAATIQDPVNSGQTPTMANFATLADALAACVTRVQGDSTCGKLFEAAKGPKGNTPTDTLTAAEAIARYPWYQPKRVFDLLELYPIPNGKTMRAVPYMPYLQWPPSAWVIPLKFTGGGYVAGGKAMFDSEGNLWVGDNFTVGWQGQDALWQGHATKFDPNGKPLSPITTGFSEGGMQGGSFGTAVDANDNAWFSNYGGKCLAVFDKNGKPLTPPEGITFNGQLGLMQGIIATPSGDVWALGLSKNQLLFFPKGDWTKGRILCEGRDVAPCSALLGPFHLAIDQQDRIWVSNALAGHVARFPAADPSKVEKFETSWSGSGMSIDSQGNVWVSNRLGNSDRGGLVIAHVIERLKLGENGDETMTK